MFGTTLRRAVLSRLASASRVALAVSLSVVLTASLTPSVSWAADVPEADGALSSFEQNQGAEVAAFLQDALEGSAVTDEPAGDIAAASSAPASFESETAGQSIVELDDADMIQASISFIGVDADGEPMVWASEVAYSVEAGSTAADLSEMLLADSGLTAEYGLGSWGWSLDTVMSPVDGKVYGWDAATSKYWQLFVNGELSDYGAGEVVLQDADVVTWYYAAWGDALPGEGSGEGPGDGSEEGDKDDPADDPSDDPAADLPEYDSSWPFYAGGGTSLEAPAGDVETAWTATLKDAADWGTSVSDPIVVNGNVYIAVGDTLLCKSAADGQTLFQATLAASINSTARIAYVDGLIVVPLAQGRLQALRADNLKTVWTTEALPEGSAGDQQPLTTLTVSDGCVYYGTASADWVSTYGGFFQCVDAKTGRVIWSYEDQEAGFYWAGAAVSGEFVVIANDNGALRAFAQDGSVAGQLDLGVRVRSTVVASGSSLFVVSNDGALHKVAVAADGSMREVASVSFGSSSTTTPVLVNGKVIVAGASTQSYDNSWGGVSYYGVLAVIDAETMQVEHSVTTLTNGDNLPADSKSAPLVSVQGDKTYVYITCNAEPGGVYRYCIGDAAAQEIYVPEAALQNYCMASIVVDARGVLYYTNDSGALFALKGVTGESGGQGGSSDSGNPGSGGSSDGGQAGQGGGQSSGTSNQKPSQQSGGSAASGGAVPAANKPVAASDSASQGKEDAKQKDDAAEGKDASNEVKTTSVEDASALTTGKAADEASEQGSELGLDSLALAGLGVGVVGLLGVALFLLKRRA